jgi:Spy/CpxP family protein refolding chaperone
MKKTLLLALVVAILSVGFTSVNAMSPNQQKGPFHHHHHRHHHPHPHGEMRK